MIRIESKINGIDLCNFYVRSAIVDVGGAEDSTEARQDGQCVAMIDSSDIPSLVYTTDYIGDEGEHGAEYGTEQYNLLFVKAGTYYLERLASEATITDLDDIVRYLIIAWAYSYDGSEELFLFNNDLDGQDYTDTF